MENITKPKLVFFQFKNEGTSKFVLLHRQQHVKCLSQFFNVIVISEDCDYQQICDRYQPDLVLFESGVNYPTCHRLEIKNTHVYPEIPKLGFHNGDPWCEARAAFISDMQHWGIETFFGIGTTTAEHTPEIAENLFVWPNFIDSDIYRDYGQSKVVSVMFTGYISPLYPWRQQIYKIVSKYYPSLTCPHLGYTAGSEWRMIHGEQYARTINASWFVPTCGSVEKDIVRKHLEIPASKSCLITEATPVIEAAGFIDMQNCIFVDETNVLDKLDYLFQHPEQLEKITNAGYQLVQSRHTLKQRDQIFQWFNLHKNLKPNQKIVQTSPFEPLTIVEKSSGIENSHIISNGLIIELLRQGDEKLWAGKYEQAEALYFQCLNYISWMPEPKLRLTLCNLYKGDAETALSWVLQPIKYTLDKYKAVNPDPLEWAYFIISLLCKGKLDEAAKSANQFPLLFHPELERIQLVINFLTTKNRNNLPLQDKVLKYYPSVHQLPNLSFDEWIDHLCLLLQNCQQFDIVEELKPLLGQNQLTKINLTSEKKTKNISLTNINYQSMRKLLRFTQLSDIDIKFKRIKTKIKTKILNVFKHLNKLEKRFGYFLPYRFSEIKNDEFFHIIERLTQEEDIKTALVIGASSGKGTSEALLTGIQRNSTKPTTFCINIPIPKFVKLQKRYASNSNIRCYDFYPTSQEHLPEQLENSIKKIQQENQINCFDVLLFDSELTFSFESSVLNEASLILIDDINTAQSYKIYRRFITDKTYTLVAQNPSLRNGYAIFRSLKIGVMASSNAVKK